MRPLPLALLALTLSGAACDSPRPIPVSLGEEKRPALYWKASRRLAPAVLLLRAPGSHQEDWIPLGRPLREEGYAVLLLELREAGRSSRDLWVAEARAGFEFLRAEKEVDAARIGLIGAEGAALAALEFATREPLARLAVLLSPALDDGGEPGEAALRQYGFRPLLLVAAADDPLSAATVRHVAGAAPGKTVVELSPGTARGGALIAADAELTPKIRAFLKAHL